MKALRLLATQTFGAAGAAAAQLAITQPTEKLLILPLPVAIAADSAASVAAMDAARERLTQLARYKVLVVPKAKICEALEQSGFPCNGLMTDQQAGQLARALGINSYTTGQVTHNGPTLIARIRVLSGAGGFASAFTVNGGATPLALGEAIAQKLNSVIRAGEFARSCNEQRGRSAFDRALAEARKALAIEPDLAAANLCIVTVFEARRAPADSIIAAARRALKGDPGNSEAWNRIASTLMVKGDTLGAFVAYDSLLTYNPTDANLRKGLAQLLQQQRQYERAERLLSDGLKLTPGDQAMSDLRKRVCIEGGLYACTLDILKAEVTADTAKLADTTVLKLGLANAQAASDSGALLWWARQAARRYPSSVSFIKQLGGAFQMAGQIDSAVFYFQKALALSPGDVATSLLIAKTIVDHAVWDTAAAGACQRRNDTTCLRQLRSPFVAKLEPARQYLAGGYASPDSALRLTTAVVGLSGGSKLAQAGAYDAAFPWLDQLLTQLAPRSPADTTGPRHQIRVQGSFWYGLSSALSLGPSYQQMVKDKSCDQAKAVNDRLQRSIQAIDLGGRVAPSVAIQMRSILMQYQAQMPKVKQAFKCSSF
ncbi:MAG: tetratricopeptide repeat protein [Gemmatimonadales bacterium]